MAGSSHYRALGVGERASAREIRTAYLNLARALHPDRMVSSSEAERALAERRMREVNAAWEVLKDPDRRAAYDHDRQPSATSRPTARATTATRPRPAEAPTGNPERFDADPFARPTGPLADDPDDVELSRAQAFLLQRGPLILLLAGAVFIFLVTAYAGGNNPNDELPPAPATSTTLCVDTPITGVTGGSVVLDPC